MVVPPKYEQFNKTKLYYSFFDEISRGTTYFVKVVVI